MQQETTCGRAPSTQSSAATYTIQHSAFAILRAGPIPKGTLSRILTAVQAFQSDSYAMPAGVKTIDAKQAQSIHSLETTKGRAHLVQPL